MNIIFKVEGGLGKHIASTAIVKVIKKHYPNSRLIVISAHPEVYANNDLIYKALHIDQQKGLYSKYIENKQCKIFITNPYAHYTHIENETHLLESWCKVFGLEYKGEQPEIILTSPEIDYFSQTFKSDKPIFALHSNGGPIENGSLYSWPRDLPDSLIHEVINKYKDSHNIVHIKAPHQFTYPNTTPCSETWRGIAILLIMADKRLLIDSFAQHLAASLQLPSTVCWITTKPKVFGYEIHDNITAEPFTKKTNLDDAVFQQYDLHEDLSKIPYEDTSQIFDTNKIINSLNK